MVTEIKSQEYACAVCGAALPPRTGRRGRPVVVCGADCRKKRKNDVLRDYQRRPDVKDIRAERVGKRLAMEAATERAEKSAAAANAEALPIAAEDAAVQVGPVRQTKGPIQW